MVPLVPETNQALGCARVDRAGSVDPIVQRPRQTVGELLRNAGADVTIRFSKAVTDSRPAMSMLRENGSRN